MAGNKTITFELVERIANISTPKWDGSRLELNRVKWNGHECLDLRRWKKDENGERIPLKGITLNEDDMQVIGDICQFLRGEVCYARDFWEPDPAKVEQWRQETAEREAMNAAKRKRGKEGNGNAEPPKVA